MADEEQAPEVKEEVTLSRGVEMTLQSLLGEAGCMVTGFLGVVTYLDEDGARCWAFLHNEDGSAVHDLGMAQVISKTVDRGVEMMMFGADDDDEVD